MSRLRHLHLSFSFVLSLTYPSVSQAETHHVPIKAGDSPEAIIAKAAQLTPNRSQLLHHQDEFNGFIHFGLNTFSGVELGNGKEDPKIFNPPTVDTDQWCRIMKTAGMRKVVITAKHHDGYCTWQTRYNKEFSVHQSAWKNGKGDVLRQLSESCQKYGLKLGVYLSPTDLFQIESPTGLYGNESNYQDSIIPTDPASFKTNPMKPRSTTKNLPTFKVSADDYNRYFMNQLYEVLTEYGPIHEVWFDDTHPKRKGGQSYIREEWFKMIRKLAPDAAILGGPDVRWCGNEHGATRKSEWNAIPIDNLAVSGYDRPAQNVGTDQEILAKDYEVHGKKLKSNYLYYIISEVDVSIRHGWFWRNDSEQKVREVGDIFDIYERSVGGNAVFSLSIPPNKDGKFSPRDEATLIKVGERITNTYGSNLASGASSNAPNLFDNKLNTFWQPKGETGAFRVTMPKAQTVNRIVLQEDIETTGQRVREHAVDAWINGSWKEIGKATTIGHKKIMRFTTVTTDKFRVRILSSRLAPTISTFSAHYYQSPPPAVIITRNSAGKVQISPKIKQHQSTNSELSIHHTLDGSNPTAQSPKYTQPFDLPKGGIVKARSFTGTAFGPISSNHFGISQKRWKLVAFSSEHDATYGAAKAIDGDPNTFWHTSWSTNQKHPHQLTIDLGKKIQIKGITYLPRQDKRIPNGMVESGSIDLSQDGKTWLPSGNFTFANLLKDPSQRTFLFPKTGQARYLRFNSKTGAQDTPYAGAAEIQVLSN